MLQTSRELNTQQKRYLTLVLTHLDMGAVVRVLCRQRPWEGIRLLLLLLPGSVAVRVTLLLGKPSSPALTVQLQVHRCLLVSLVILHVCEGGSWRETEHHMNIAALHHNMKPNQNTENMFTFNHFEAVITKATADVYCPRKFIPNVN